MCVNELCPKTQNITDLSLFFPINLLAPSFPNCDVQKQTYDREKLAQRMACESEKKYFIIKEKKEKKSHQVLRPASTSFLHPLLFSILEDFHEDTVTGACLRLCGSSSKVVRDRENWRERIQRVPFMKVLSKERAFFISSLKRFRLSYLSKVLKV